MTIEQLNTAVREAESAVKAANVNTAVAVEALVEAQGMVREASERAQRCRDAGYRAGTALHRAQYRLNEAVSNEVASGFDGLSREELERRLQVEVRGKTLFAGVILKTLENRAVFKQGLERKDLYDVAVNRNGRAKYLTDAQMSRVMVAIEAWCPIHPTSGRYLPPYEMDSRSWSQS